MNIRSQLFIHPPRWQRAHHGSLPRSRIDPATASWLFEPGSLTQRLCRLVGEGFRVFLLRQSWQKPGMDEARQLGLKPGPAASVWGRRSLYSLGPEHKLLVAEFFLPPLFQISDP